MHKRFGFLLVQARTFRRYIAITQVIRLMLKDMRYVQQLAYNMTTPALVINNIHVAHESNLVLSRFVYLVYQFI
jgi:predicted permease